MFYPNFSYLHKLHSISTKVLLRYVKLSMSRLYILLGSFQYKILSSYNFTGWITFFIPLPWRYNTYCKMISKQMTKGPNRNRNHNCNILREAYLFHVFLETLLLRLVFQFWWFPCIKPIAELEFIHSFSIHFFNKSKFVWFPISIFLFAL